MQLKTPTTVALFLTGLCKSASAAPTAAACGITGFMPELEYAFSVEIYKSDPFKLVDISGGKRIIEPFYSNGTVFGPLLNGTVLGGQETGIFTYNMTTFQPIVTAYGQTSDGVDFIATVTGVGSTKPPLFAQVQIIANAPYDNYQNLFFLGVLTDSGSESIIDVYLVENGSTGRDK